MYSTAVQYCSKLAYAGDLRYSTRSFAFATTTYVVYISRALEHGSYSIQLVELCDEVIVPGTMSMIFRPLTLGAIQANKRRLSQLQTVPSGRTRTPSMAAALKAILKVSL